MCAIVLQTFIPITSNKSVQFQGNLATSASFMIKTTPDNVPASSFAGKNESISIGSRCGQNHGDSSVQTSIPDNLSIKLTVVSFFSACSIVFLHAFENHLKDTGSPGTAWFITLFSRIMTSFAVPIFFVISGYLFARKTDFCQKDWYSFLLKKRSKSLLFPYFAWCTIYACIVTPFTVFGNHLAGRAPTVNTCLQEPLLSIWNLFRIYGLNFELIPPAAGSLWYIRNLFILFLLTPCLVPLMKRRNLAIGYLILSTEVFTFHDWFPRSCWQFFETGISLRGLFAFPLGMYLAYYPVKPDSFKILRRTIPFLWLALSIASTWLMLYPVPGTDDLKLLLMKFVTLSGICAVWVLPDMIPALLRAGSWSIAKDSFLLYAIHQGIMGVVMCARVEKILLVKIHVPVLGIFLLRFLIPLTLSLLIIEFLKRFFPAVHRLLSGGR